MNEKVDFKLDDLTADERAAYEAERLCALRDLREVRRETHLDVLVAEVLAEVRRAQAKFPTWPTDPLHALAVLGEEFGELSKAMLQLTYEPHKSSHEEVRSEAVQTAAMALRLLASLDRYAYVRGAQHLQDGDR